MVTLAGGVPSRAAAMKQGLIDGVAVNPPNEYDLEKAGFRELANFRDLKMPYAGVPHTVSRRVSRSKAKSDGRLHDGRHRGDGNLSHQ